MTEPERISKRSSGLAAQLLQAGAEEQPADASVQRVLAALGVSGAVVTTTSAAAGALAGGAKAGSALGASAGGTGLGVAVTGGAVKSVSGILLVKWIGLGVVGGMGLAGAAAVATAPASSPVARPLAASARPVAPSSVSASRPKTEAARPAPPPSDAEALEVFSSTPPANVAPPRASTSELGLAAPPLDVGAPLAAEVAYVDRARALLVAGQAEPGLSLLRGYERAFPEARLLPEVLFLQLETYDRLGRQGEARGAAQRLLEGFPKSPHASRARRLLFP